jgi:hypothetical protein
MSTESTAEQRPGFDQSNVKTRRPRGTSEKAVASVVVNAVTKIYVILLPLDKEQRIRVQDAVTALLGDPAP